MCQTIENLQTECGYRNRPSPAAPLPLPSPSPSPLSHQLQMLWTAVRVAIAMAIARSQALSTAVGCCRVSASVSVNVSVALAVYLSCRCRCCLCPCLWHVSHVSKCLLIKMRASRIVLVLVHFLDDDDVVLVSIVVYVSCGSGWDSAWVWGLGTAAAFGERALLSRAQHLCY